MQTLTINIQNNALTQKVMWMLEHFKDDGVEVVQNENIPDQWDYWSNHEIDHFGKFAIGLSQNNYDDDSTGHAQTGQK